MILPQLYQLAQLGRQAAQLVAGQVQRAQVDELADLVRQPHQTVVVQVERGQVLELPQRRAEVAHAAGYLDAVPAGLFAGRDVLRREKRLLPPGVVVVVLVFISGHLLRRRCLRIVLRGEEMGGGVTTFTVSGVGAGFAELFDPVVVTTTVARRGGHDAAAAVSRWAMRCGGGCCCKRLALVDASGRILGRDVDGSCQGRVVMLERNNNRLEKQTCVSWTIEMEVQKGE